MPYVKNSERYRRRSRRSRGRRRIALTFLVACLAVAIVLALRPHTGATPAKPSRIVSEQGMSLARRPAAPHWGDAARTDLQASVRAALASGTQNARAWSCVVIAQDGTVLYDDRGSNAVTPASALKLVVADAALTSLTPQFRFDTLLAAMQPPGGATLDGDLWLIGSGDPSLRSEDLLAGVRALREKGVQSIHGRVVVDGSAVAGEEINPLWNADDGNEDFMTATSGISVDGDTVEFDVTGTSPGQAANVQVKPQAPQVRYYGSITSGGGDNVVIAASGTPNEFRLSGNIPPGIQEKFWVPVHGIPQYAGGVVNRFLQKSGVSIAHEPQTGTAPLETQILWEHRSKPLPDLLKHMLTVSDNHFAEQLMRTVGGTSGDTADDRNGLAAERRVLAAQAIPTPGLRLFDGSGLAHANRIAATTLGHILSYLDADPHGNMMYPLLPRGGRDGTLRMYHFTSAAGRVRAKSGHLSDAASLAGYVDTRKHGRVVFVFMINGSPGDPDAAIVSAVDRIAQR